MYSDLKGIVDFFFPLINTTENRKYLVLILNHFYAAIKEQYEGFYLLMGPVPVSLPVHRSFFSSRGWRWSLGGREMIEQLLLSHIPEALEVPPVSFLGTASCSFSAAFCSHFSENQGIACGSQHFRTQNMTSCFAFAEGFP